MRPLFLCSVAGLNGNCSKNSVTGNQNYVDCSIRSLGGQRRCGSKTLMCSRLFVIPIATSQLARSVRLNTASSIETTIEPISAPMDRMMAGSSIATRVRMRVVS